ncbi:MAG: hypothetical protein IPO83_08405 [Chitinophagaceae bacterium]|nr:hypothetical protein [Chitinophagaceae bacterium]
MVPIHAIREAMPYDNTLLLTKATEKGLAEKYLAPRRYTRNKLYQSMFEGKTIVFTDYPISLKVPQGADKISFLSGLLQAYIPQKEIIKIRTGTKHRIIKVTVRETLARWTRGRSRFGVTDLHFRGTRLFDKIDADAISHFNLLPRFSAEVSFLEMLTLVISAKGIFSDSHSDDGDGSNHCFTGKKLWFAWDREEGRKMGLEDCTYDPVDEQAKFSIDKFLSLSSAHWFIVSENRTLFMPGNFAHRVITLEKYIGFGSFYVSFPNYFNAVKRWTLYESSDVTDDFINSLNINLIKLLKSVAKMSTAEKELWGVDYLFKARAQLTKNMTPEQVECFLKNETVRNLLAAIDRIAQQ